MLSMKRIKTTFGPPKTLGLCARFTAVLRMGLGASCMLRPILYRLGYYLQPPSTRDSLLFTYPVIGHLKLDICTEVAQDLEVPACNPG